MKAPISVVKTTENSFLISQSGQTIELENKEELWDLVAMLREATVPQWTADEVQKLREEGAL